MSVDRGGLEVAFRGREDRCWRRTSFDLGQQEQRGALLPSGIRIHIRRSSCRHVISAAGSGLVTAFTVLLGIGVATEARDLRGAWVTDKSTCKKVFTGEATKLRIAKDADFYGSGFIDESNRLRGKNADCVIKSQKQNDGDVLYLVTL